MTATIRWMIERDLPGVRRIEEAVEWLPCVGWREVDFKDFLKQRRNIAMVLTDEYDTILAYVLYTLASRAIIIERLAVLPEVWREGHGTALIEKLKHKVERQTKRSNIIFFVPDGLVDLHLFLRASGLRAERVVTNRCGDCTYQFVWRGMRDAPLNRISSYMVEK